MHPTTADGGCDDVRALLHRWHDDGDHAARDEVGGADAAAGAQPRPALREQGRAAGRPRAGRCVGLIKAIDRFDLSRDVRFATYAVPTIAGELKRHFRDRGWMMRVPREVQELSGRIGIARERLVGDLAARRPSASWRARPAPTRSACWRRWPRPRPTARSRSTSRSRTAPARWRRSATTTAASSAPRRARCSPTASHELAPREREIVRLRYFEGLTQREIAEHIGISQMHVSRLIRRTVEQLRERIAMPAAA